MRKNNIHNVRSTEHLSLRDLQDYSSGIMSSEEKSRVDTHLVECELCSEALSGTSSMKDPMKLIRITHELQIRAHRKKTIRPKTFSQIQLLSIILILMFLILIVYLGMFYIKRV